MVKSGIQVTTPPCIHWFVEYGFEATRFGARSGQKDGVGVEILLGSDLEPEDMLWK